MPVYYYYVERGDKDGKIVDCVKYHIRDIKNIEKYLFNFISLQLTRKADSLSVALLFLTVSSLESRLPTTFIRMRKIIF